jgi:hypothetical protein
MEKYILTITENGHERIVCIGTTLEGMRQTAESFPSNEYQIYETKMVEYGIAEKIIK